MRPSPLMIATVFLALCGAFVIVVPARGDEEWARIDSSSASVGTLAAGACKSVATFTSSAVPALQKDGCTGCHSRASGSAKGALDLTDVGTNDAAACAQVLAKVNLANRAQSAIIQAPAGAQSHMGGKVHDPQAFTAAMLGWINNE